MAQLPQKEIVPALLMFNLGVETGQLVFIAVVLVAVGHSDVRAAFYRVEFPGGYALGLPASFWCFQRLQAFWQKLHIMPRRYDY